jgi:hypothetical protein
MKHKVYREDFINWYFDDKDDFFILAKDMVRDLRNEGRCSLDVQDLWDRMEEVPKWIIEGWEEESTYIDIKKCKLICD